MIKPENLKVDPDRVYSFKSPLKTRIVRAVDAIGKTIFSPKSDPISWKGIKRVAVLRLDHLGDVLLALPALKALETALPQAEVDFLVGPWAADIVELAGLRSKAKVFSASWFSREGGRESAWKSIKGLEGFLRAGNYDAVVELRGDFRHILAMKRAGVKYRIGAARTGLGFLLTHPLIYRPGLHEIERNSDMLEQAGIPLLEHSQFPVLKPRKEDIQVQLEVRQRLGVRRVFISIHAVCAATAKRWPAPQWGQLIDHLPEDMDVVLVGTVGEKDGMVEIQNECHRKTFLAAGLLDLPALTAFLQESALFLGVDSGPAHIAAAVGTTVISLYSGTNQVKQWGPRGPKVTVIQKTPPCSPCELKVCPIGIECMREIKVDEVLNHVRGALQPSV